MVFEYLDLENKLWNGNKICVHYGAGFLFVFKACPVINTGA